MSFANFVDHHRCSRCDQVIEVRVSIDEDLLNLNGPTGRGAMVATEREAARKSCMDTHAAECRGPERRRR